MAGRVPENTTIAEDGKHVFSGKRFVGRAAPPYWNAVVPLRLTGPRQDDTGRPPRQHSSLDHFSAATCFLRQGMDGRYYHHYSSSDRMWYMPEHPGPYPAPAEPPSLEQLGITPPHAEPPLSPVTGEVSETAGVRAALGVADVGGDFFFGLAAYHMRSTQLLHLAHSFGLTNSLYHRETFAPGGPAITRGVAWDRAAESPTALSPLHEGVDGGVLTVPRGRAVPRRGSVPVAGRSSGGVDGPIGARAPLEGEQGRPLLLLMLLYRRDLMAAGIICHRNYRPYLTHPMPKAPKYVHPLPLSSKCLQQAKTPQVPPEPQRERAHASPE